MTDSFPPLSNSVIIARTAFGAVIDDCLREEVTFVNETAALVATACRTSAPRASTIATWANQAGLDPIAIAVDVERTLETFAQNDLIGREQGSPLFAPAAPVHQLSPFDTATVQLAGIHAIRFSGTDPSLVALVDQKLQLETTTQEPNAAFTICEQSDGSVLLTTDTEWHFADRDELQNRIVTVVNDFVARTLDELVLHAAAMIAPNGDVVVFAAPPGSGKSTLAGALTQQQWCYLGDESATIRNRDLAILPYPKPLSLSASGCAALGIAANPPTNGDDEDVALERISAQPCKMGTPTNPVRAVVLPCYVGPEGVAMSNSLVGNEAIVALIANSLNLRYVGDRGLETLVDLAENVPVHQLAYRSTDELITQLDDLGWPN